MQIEIKITNPTLAVLSFLAGQNVTTVTNDDDAILSRVMVHDAEDEPVNTNAPLTDSTGLPWDARIHSAGKTLTANGQWRIKKGIDKAIVDSVESELRTPAPAPPAGLTPAPAPAPPAGLTPQQLVKLITDNKVAPASVVEALQSVGLTALPEIFRKPELAQTVATLLGIG